MVSADFWNNIKTSVKMKNSKNMPLQMWFNPTSLIQVEEDPVSGKRFRLGVPTELHKYWISENLLELITAEISAKVEGRFELELVVTGNNEEGPSADKQGELLNAPGAIEKPVVENEKWSQKKDLVIQANNIHKNRDALNVEYTFSTFVVGRNNEFAHAASYNISKNPGADNYNPLFICGPTGMGKTHLLNAVGNYIRDNFPHLKISYLSAEKFLNECISSIRRNEMDKFRKKYRHNCDVLLIDDVQILGRGQAVQEEFFYTLNEFFDNGQQVVVASDRMPKDIIGLEDRIRTRLEWGLIADIQMPDIETRVAILKYKAERRGIRLPNEVVSYIARISKRSIRELEGNLNKVKMFSELQGLSISLDLVKKVLAVHDETVTITTDEIKKISAEHFKIKLNDLNSKSRTKSIVTARQVAMYFIKKHLDKSYVDIGRNFGGRDHTTVMNALRRIEDQQNKNLDLKRDIEEIEAKIHNITGL
ncbi:MAG: chromosomal replication initiator protein DnaA [Bdellovibrionaceae bacterium]|nr:chromosomal replication initiator protein DnaA [Pseudobdellovibrionaceae bacterium]